MDTKGGTPLYKESQLDRDMDAIAQENMYGDCEEGVYEGKKLDTDFKDGDE